jgi:ligand-binding sensor domain-containing protein
MKIDIIAFYTIFVLELFILRMLKRILNIIVLFSFVFGFSQSNQLWQGYFSYNQITDVSESSKDIYASSQNAFFSKNFNANDIKTTTSVDGLKAETITALYHSDTFNQTFVGNKNGLLLVVNHDGTILYKKGILDEVPVSPLIKRINHFLEYNGKLYISCDYGITVFDLTTLEFGDTYYMGPLGTFISVQQTTIQNGFIYAATKGNLSGSGIRKADLSNQFLDDYNQWVDQTGSEWNGVVTLGTQVIALRTDGVLFKYIGTSFVQFFQLPEAGVDIRASNDNLIVTTKNHVYVYDTTLQQVAHIQNYQFTTAYVTFSCATIIDTTIYIGTNENGLLSSPISNPTNFDVILPNGPIYNNIFRLKKTSSKLWATYGGYDITFVPTPDNSQKAISTYNSQTGWSSIPFSQLQGAVSLTDIVANPKDDNEVYVCSFQSGLLKIKNGVTTLYNELSASPNGPQSQQWGGTVPASYISVRINGATFDSKNNLWMSNALIYKPLKVLKSDAQWQTFDFTNLLEDPNYESYGKIAIDKNDTKWVPTFRANGLIAFNEKYSNKFIKIKTGTDGNLPSVNVRCVAVDNKNQLWIGTTSGLRIIPSVDSFISETEIQSKSIIILENDLAQELFYDQFISDIAVDGANRKWVAIAESGVYLVSANGQETIYHFTKENSPLPSNNISDIEIDGTSGEVFFATDKGLVSFKGTSTRASDDLNSVYVYPNPVRPEFEGTVKISNLTNKAIVKITDIEGNLVFETTSEGGTIEWDTTAFGKYKVASGVYLILISAQDGIETTIKKVMIIR